MAALLGGLREIYTLTVCPVVYAELLAGPGATVPVIREMLTVAGVVLDEALPLELWAQAGAAYGRYAQRRAQSGGGLPRRRLADFVVGAHAARTCTALVTLDPQHYRLGFPELDVLVP